MTEALRLPEGPGITRPSPARIYDCLLRGTRHFAADEDAARRLLSAVPEIRDCAWSNLGFRQRAATWIARQGVRQFLDIGSGLPVIGNTHELVKKIHPEARVVYVGNDPMEEPHGPASGETGATGGTVAVVRADLREPDTVLGHPSVRTLIDADQPAGLLLTGAMTFVADSADPWRLVSSYASALRPGSYLALSHLTDDAKPPRAVAGFLREFDDATEHLYFRSKAEVARFFDGLEIVPPFPGGAPGLTYCGLWGAEDLELADSDGSRWLYCAVARIP